jgi:hypothetical protein
VDVAALKPGQLFAGVSDVTYVAWWLGSGPAWVGAMPTSAVRKLTSLPNFRWCNERNPTKLRLKQTEISYQNHANLSFLL